MSSSIQKTVCHPADFSKKKLRGSDLLIQRRKKPESQSVNPLDALRTEKTCVERNSDVSLLMKAGDEEMKFCGKKK